MFDKKVPELEIDLAVEDVPSVRGAYGTALEHQPEYQAAIAATEQLKYDVILARSRSRPQLDLGGVVGYSSRAESV